MSQAPYARRPSSSSSTDGFGWPLRNGRRIACRTRSFANRRTSRTPRCAHPAPRSSLPSPTSYVLRQAQDNSEKLTPRISVVVPTYNRLDTLRYVVPSLVAQDLPRGEFEVVIADSNSTDGTAEYLAEVAREHPFVRHLPGPYTGRASARNAGIEAAQAPLVMFTDADIIASPDLLSRHLAHHVRPGTRAVVGIE